MTKRGDAVMLTKPKVPIVTLEEHYWDEELSA